MRLDVQAFAHAAASLSGEWPADAMPRYCEGAQGRWPAVRYSVRGEEKPVLGAQPEIWLHLQVEAQAEAECQRCLGAVQLPLLLDLHTRFVRSEDEAAALDGELEDDVLVLSRRFDLQEWVEDELLLALPIVPMHERCPTPLPMAAEEAPVNEETDRPHPFAALAALKGKTPR